eukprot:1242424-Amphidinium_carterae.1
MSIPVALLPKPSKDKGRCFMQPYPETRRYQCYYERDEPGQKSKSGTYTDDDSEVRVLRMLLHWAWH